MKHLKLRAMVITLLASIAMLVIACGAGRTDSPELPAATDLRLYVFDCGTLKADPARFRLKPEEVATTDLSVPCFLVVHPQGRLIWDSGAVPDADWTPTGGPVTHHLVLPDGGERDLTLRKPLVAQLAEAGYSPADVSYLAFSHYHYDHTANANAFASATWLVRQVERDAMFAEKPPGVMQPGYYSALKNSKTVIIPASDDYDVFGDGTVIMKFASGHTPGDAIEAFLTKTGAQLWIQHDHVGNSRLKKAPEYYD
ncbi:MAG: MBL fold metallo-hydrolase [Vicinamibacterales bacterium]